MNKGFEAPQNISGAFWCKGYIECLVAESSYKYSFELVTNCKNEDYNCISSLFCYKYIYNKYLLKKSSWSSRYGTVVNESD